MGYTTEQIEDEILSAIQDSDMGSYCKTIESYAGQLEDDITKMIILFPAVFVMFSGSEAKMLTGLEYEKTVDFTIFVAAKNLRGNVAARKNDYGAYQMLDDMETLLVGNQLGMQIEPIAIVSEEAILNTKQLSVYAAGYRTVFVAEKEWGFD